MTGTTEDQPSTKGDLKNAVGLLRTELKDGLASVRTEFKDEIASVKTELKGEITSVKTELKGDIENLSGEFLKMSFRMDRMEDTLNTKVAMKSDLNRIFNLLDSIVGDVKRYQREDTLRGDAVIRHEEKLSDHETRITVLESK